MNHEVLVGVTAKVFDDTGERIIPVIGRIFNLSIISKTFLREWRIALVTPIYKE